MTIYIDGLIQCSCHRILKDVCHAQGQPRTAQTFLCCGPGGLTVDVINVHAPSGKKTLTDMGLDYLDLYLIHFPLSLKFVPFETRYPPGHHFDEESGIVEDPTPLSETWAAMDELVNEGLVRHIGVSNMGTSLIRDLWSYAKIKPAVL